jgi:hypothetical protein
LKCISKQLGQNKHFQHIDNVLHPSHHDPLNKVHITTVASVIDPLTGILEDVTIVQVIDTQAALETRILECNKKHFAQAEGTPFTMEQLKSMTADNFQDYLMPREIPSTPLPGPSSKLPPPSRSPALLLPTLSLVSVPPSFSKTLSVGYSIGTKPILPAPLAAILAYTRA